MKRFWTRPCLSCFAVVGVAGATVLLLTQVLADGKRPSKELPQTQPPAQVVQNAVKAPLRADGGKYEIEMPTKQLLAARSLPVPAAASAEFVNPKVQPGKVRWHKDFATARAAATKSHKPVLLFQMMGKLDDQFC